MPLETAVKISMDAVTASNDRENELDHESIVCAVNRLDEAGGWIEAYVVRARAPHPENLPPLPPLQT